MSREIKFRAWDHEEGRMYHGVECGIDLGIEVHFRDILDGWPGRNFSVMQYTGLKDKNGKEIYEGDKPDGIWGDSVIFWCDECCGFSIGYEEIEDKCMACDGDAHWSEFVQDVRDGKVTIIGNIHEHPAPTN